MHATGKLMRIVVATVFVASSMMLAGCRQDEQGRILSYEKGKYLGNADEELTDAQKDALRYRAKSIQKF